MFLRLPQESKQASKPAGKQASKQESKEASKQARKQASKEASKQASKQGSKQRSKQASKQASKEAIKQSGKSSKVIKMSQNVTKISQKCHKKVTKMSSDLLPPISFKSPQNGSLFGLLLKPAFRRNWAGALFSRQVSGSRPGTPSKKYYYMLSPGPCGCQ